MEKKFFFKSGNKHFWLPDHQLAESLILVYGFYKRARKGICH